jgi:two-component system sensor histidine kinase KdpD
MLLRAQVVSGGARRDASPVRVLSLIERQSKSRYATSVAGPAVATGIALAIGSGRTTAAALVYLLGVVAPAATGGIGPGIAASILSFVGLNFFFTPPRHALSVAKSDDLIALFVFVSVAMVVSTLVARALSQATRAERREHETRSLHGISSHLLTDDIDAGCVEIARVLRDLFALARCEVLTNDVGGERLRAAEGDGGGEGVRIPLQGSGKEMGTLVLVPGARGLGEAERRVAAVFAHQIAAGLERAELEAEAREARVTAEAERVRRALLSAVGHDFRTPLASIKAAVTALLPGDDARVSEAHKNELLRTALEETERLERLVSNLLDLSRIRSGAIAPECVAVAVDDLIDDTLAGLREQLRGHSIALVVRDDVPKLYVDPVQTGQALRNILENAAKFAPRNSEIRITAAGWRDAVELRVSDRGPGIPEGERAAVFEEFYRGGDHRVDGTGLGLAIARALVEANGGKIAVEQTPGGGATLVVRLPAEARA